MPFRSRISLASGTGSSTKHDDKGVPSSKEDETPYEKLEHMGSPTPLTHGALESSILPAPVQSSLSSGRRGKVKKSARISNGLKVHWDRFLRRVGNGTAPSSSSAVEDSTGGGSSAHARSRLTRILPEDPDEPVDEVVVDREWSDDIKTSSLTHSEHGASPEKSGGSNHLGGTTTDHESLALHAEGFCGMGNPFVWLRWRIWPVIHGFFCTKFMDEKSEAHYTKENWFLRKNLAIWTTAFLIVNMALAAGFVPTPAVLPDRIFFYGIAPGTTAILVPMVIYDWPRDRPFLYQIFLTYSLWQWSLYNLITLRICGKYGGPVLVDCSTKDFLTLFYYTSALQAIGLFGLKLHRFPAMIGALIFFILGWGLIVPLKTNFLRNLINFAAYQAFLLYVHYMRENSERRLYTLRDQLKIQFRATQKAQVNERKAADSKRRLTSYVFHEVRVPLNTALLAVQNMEAYGSVAKAQEIEFKALEGSLTMMSKVLNDVLDFNRMDSGRFESVLKPYSFHQVMRSLFIPLQLATDARGLEFVKDLDMRIDEVARTALYEALGESPDQILRRLIENAEEDGIVVGDETRLRQIITNLASNACKFTPTGGKLIIKTRLIVPHASSKLSSGTYAELGQDQPDLPVAAGNGEAPPPSDDIPETESQPRHTQLSTNHLSQHNSIHSKPAPPLEWIVVRIEVTDTGCGIRAKDMVQTKLFSAFNQTEQGRQQGGKGTGLGLALVRQIVKLSGGRLGVQSKVNEGSTFWVELPLGVGTKAIPGIQATNIGDLTASRIHHPGTSSSLSTHIPIDPTIPKTLSKEAAAASASSDSVNDRSTSALHSIMEQGGMVEISTKRGEPTAIVTRTIGDPNTGTDYSPRTTSSPQPSISERRNQPNAGASNETMKPVHLTLPKPQRFSLDDNSMPDISPGSPSSTQVGSTSSVVANATVSTPDETSFRVLVVDDDPLTRKLMSRMLTRLGCKVYTAENGELALDLILGTGTRPTPSSEDTGSGGLCLDSLPQDEDRFAVIFLDNQMPVLSGLEAVARLRNMGRRDFVVGVTGNALLTDQQDYLDAGVDHVLTKPVYEKSLKTMLAIAEERRGQGTPASEKPGLTLPTTSTS